ncbi:MAG TPA: endopeptidase La, partial [Anaerolineae bacterium]|nr:endopeptidase La [Anaerolineae bacterium]
MAQQTSSSAVLPDDWFDEQQDAQGEGYSVHEFPVLPLRDTVIFPHMVAPLFVGRDRSIRSIELALESADARIVLVTQRDEEIEDPEPPDLYSVGTEVTVARKLRMPDGSINVWVQGQRRVRVVEFTQVDPCLRGMVTPVEETVVTGLSTDALMRAVLALFEKVVQLSHSIPEDAYVAAMNAEKPGDLADLIASLLELDVARRQEILEVADCTERLQRLSIMLASELDVLELESRIHSQVQQEVDKSQREYFLREQMRVIQNELGEGDPHLQEIAALKAQMAEARLPSEVREKAEKELSRLATMPPSSPEVAVIRTYLDWLLELPWENATDDSLDIGKASKILEESHYGLPKAKERILEHIAVHRLAAEKMRNPILCFVGPPGTGKTSLGKAIAESLGRKFVRISLGGIRDEAELRGHRRTYVGALPGRIIQTMRRAGSRNPVFMLDEIDKLGLDFRGDPASALLEVLDPEQNSTFSDHYLEVAFDLSKVMFITTANLLDPIPDALQDRMEVVEFPGYLEDEKVLIANRFLIPRQLEQNGLVALDFSEGALQALIREHTHESGVRNLDRQIAQICRKVALRVAEGKPAPRHVVKLGLDRYLGPPRYAFSEKETSDQVGVATGLAWTEAGGDTLSIEVIVMPGKGQLILTGQLGEVMQESAQAALSYTRSRAEGLGIGDIDFDKIDLHVHVPEGAVPKDGPSAG